MEENVALDANKQKKFNKSISGIKKLLKKNETKVDGAVPGQEPVKVGKTESVKKGKKSRERGLVYLSHIPHGFYEQQMTDYFKQFGHVTNVRVIRSKKTGRSKGHAFVEFAKPIVAQIVAETMNNYLMGKRLIKAAIIPPEKQRLYAKRKRWNSVNNPSNEKRLEQRKNCNSIKTDKEDLRKARKILSNLNATYKRLHELGINYDFFTPVDVPKELSEIKKENEEAAASEIKIKTKTKKEKKKVKEVKLDKSKGISEIKIIAVPSKSEANDKKVKKAKTDQLVVEGKGVILKNTNIKPLEDFVKVKNDSESDDDDSIEFDSDEYEQMLENESDESQEDDNLGSSGTEESVVDYPPEKAKEEPSPKAVKAKGKKTKKVEHMKNNRVQVKRKALEVASNPKKPKFEKQVKQTMNKKQFKKK